MVTLVPGACYEWAGKYWIGAEQVRAAGNPDLGCKGDLIRVGFKLYEITGFESSYTAFSLRPFKATLAQGELMRLSGQAHGTP